MSLGNFRLSADQSRKDHVTILAGDGDYRVIAHISAEAINDRFSLKGESQKTRVAKIAENLGEIAALIEARYAAGNFVPYVDKDGVTHKNHYLVVI